MTDSGSIITRCPVGSPPIVNAGNGHMRTIFSGHVKRQPTENRTARKLRRAGHTSLTNPNAKNRDNNQGPPGPLYRAPRTDENILLMQKDTLIKQKEERQI